MAIIDELNNLGDAVRERSGLTEKMTMSQMADVVRNIPQPDLSPYATIEYVDEAVADIDIPDVDLSDYSTTEQMNEAISASRYKIGQGLFYNQPNNTIGINLMNSGKLVINNGMLDVNQNNLFTVQNQYFVVNTAVDNIPVVSGINTITVNPIIVGDELNNWINKMKQSPRNVLINIRMGQMGFGNAAIPNVIVNTVAINGKSYSFLMDMTAVLGPNIQQSTGFTSLFIGFNGDTFDIVFESNGRSVPPITMIMFSEFNTNPSFAHFWPDNAFRRYNNGNMMIIGLNDNYINGLIDNRLSSIGVAEAGVY